MSKLRILLIEDHLGERLNIIQVLKEFDIELDSAVTFSRGRDLATHNHYDLIISELVLSHCAEKQGDGIQFAEFLRNGYPFPPILLLAEEKTLQLTEEIRIKKDIPKIISKPTSPAVLREYLKTQMQWVEKLTA